MQNRTHSTDHTIKVILFSNRIIYRIDINRRVNKFSKKKIKS